MPRPKGSADLLEDRRKRALALLDHGYSLHEVGRRVGCAAVSVMLWRDARRRGGAQALKVRFSPGRPRKLEAAQGKRLVGLLLRGATAQGWRTNLWTTARIAELIRREFAIPYHRDHIGRLLHSLGWSVQKPERRALERDEEAIARWKRKDWPRIKKRCAAGRPPSVCRRIGIHAHPQRGAHLGSGGTDAHPSPSPGAAGQDQCHLRHFAQPTPASAEPLLPALLRQHRPGGGLRFCTRMAASPAARSSCCWIIPPPTRETPSHTSNGSIPACTSSISPPMRPN